VDPVYLILGKIGGLAAIGAAIDFLMSRSEKKRLNNWLAEWWIRFDDVRWSNFGKAEAKLAVALLDRYTGPRLWSWARWRFVFVVAAASYVVAVVWTIIRYVWLRSVDGLDLARLEADLGPDGAWRLISDAAWAVVSTDPLRWLAPEAFVGFAFVVFTFALSFSFTRYVSVLAARASTTTARTIAAFTALLALHLFLLLVWGSVMHLVGGFAVGLPNLLIDAPLAGLPLDKAMADYTESVRENLMDMTRAANPLDLLDMLSFLRVDAVTDLLDANADLLAPPLEARFVVLFVFMSFQAIMNLLANGVRLAFAILFLSSFVFRPLVQKPISRLWLAILESGKPFFTTLFGIVGAVFVLLRELRL
jgi:hypothetical protein